MRRDEHDPPVSTVDDSCGSANVIYKTTQNMVQFRRTAFGHDPNLDRHSLVISRHYRHSMIGGLGRDFGIAVMLQGGLEYNSAELFTDILPNACFVNPSACSSNLLVHFLLQRPQQRRSLAIYHSSWFSPPCRPEDFGHSCKLAYRFQ
jgi:hypothetical protein